MPYQCIKACGEVLVAARGSSIDTFNAASGSFLSTWRSVEEKSLHPQAQIAEQTENVVFESTPPAKRRKLSTDGKPAGWPIESNGPKDGEKGSKQGNKMSEKTADGLAMPAIILMTATSDNRHVIAVTGEDKTIRVFQHVLDDGEHHLKQMSQRIMPKRPCAVAITADDLTIISADKFGDVYSLPLLISNMTDESCKPLTPKAEATSAKTFLPSASTLTVHSQRNRKTLENQKKQSYRPAEKSEPMFEHTLLLGHVSMLTDIALASIKGKYCILTADRDEHIRVSRGIPQAHVIEGFCLGHNDFISRLCVPASRPEVLVSGGGDNELFVWDWAKGLLTCRTNLKVHVSDVLRELDGDLTEDGSGKLSKIAVSRIVHTTHVGSGGAEDLIIVACECVPAAFVFLLTAQSQLQYTRTFRTLGNVLDVTTVEDGGLFLSIDTFYKPGTTKVRREPDAESLDSLLVFQFRNNGMFPSAVRFKPVKYDIDEGGTLENLFYGLENLRKRDGDARDED